MTLYHGTSMRSLAPSLRKGKPNNDYGRGFYCTEDIEMAREGVQGGTHFRLRAHV